jgi:hypothetical protein
VPGELDWLLLVYRLPREPSTPRITIWRKLRRLGALQLVDGLVTLPADARTKEQLEWIADEAIEAGGEASLWVSRPTSARAERALIEQFSKAAAAEYAEVVVQATAAAADPPVRRQTLLRLRRQLRRIGQRDHFPPPEREAAHRAVESLIEIEVAR